MPSNPQSPPMYTDWQAVLDRIVPAVVALQVTAARSFQDDHAGAHGGSGFVVDAAQGLLLTNRHVCTNGPARATATFVGCPAMEEVPVRIIYVDPVHDFAFLRFDPEQLQQTPRAEIELDPAGLRVGEEIRVVGNDSMEKLQILSGTVARIDRNAPELAGDYHDENSFYALANSGTRGGSSGSPVLNRQGRAIALNAAAKETTMHGFYLPLHRVYRALQAIRAGVAVPRGTLCAALAYTSFPEVLRLGVDRAFVQRALLGGDGGEGYKPHGGDEATDEAPPLLTFSAASPPGGMLQVKSCIPGTPAAEALQPGDVLLELNGAPCADFALWDELLDRSVGRSVRLALCRQGRRVEAELVVQDQHELIPNGFMELGLGVFHAVPYQTAMKHNVPLQGVYVAQAGFVFGESVKTDAIIVEVNGSPCHDLASFEQALQQIPSREYFTVGWMLPKSAQERRKTETAVKMQRHWSVSRRWSLDRIAWTWAPQELRLLAGAAAEGAEEAEAGADEAAHQLRASPQSSASSTTATTTTMSTDGGAAAVPPPAKRARKSRAGRGKVALSKSLCSVVFRTVQSFETDMVTTAVSVENDNLCCRGVGVVIDPELGLVLTDRATVPQPLGDIEVTLGDEARGASALFVHPLHSLVVLRVDPAPGEPASEPRHFGEAAVFAKEGAALEPGDECELVAMDEHGRFVASAVQVGAVRPGRFPTYSPPRWHESNLEAIILSNGPSDPSTGVLCDAKGHIQALHAVTYSVEEDQSSRLGYGIPAEVLQPLLAHFRGPRALSSPFLVPSLEVLFGSAEISKLRRLPPRLRPSAEWLARLSSAGGSVLQVSAVTARGPCDGHVEEGDLLAAVNGEVATSHREVEATLRRAIEEAGAGKAASSAMAAVGSGDAGDGLKREGHFGSHGVDVQVELTLLRRGRERRVRISVQLLQSDGTERLLCWHGLVLREVPRSVREVGAIPPGVHIVQTMLGSPGEANEVEGEFLLAIEGAPTRSLDEVLAASRRAEAACAAGAAGAGKAAERRFLRVETADSSGRRFMRPLEPDPLFWPLVEIARDAKGGWRCEERSSF